MTERFERESLVSCRQTVDISAFFEILSLHSGQRSILLNTPFFIAKLKELSKRNISALSKSARHIALNVIQIEPYLIGGTYKGGGSASVDELNALDGKKTARQLIESGSGTITPYGVVYDNGMKLEQVYDGRFFPCYYYEPNAITVAVTAKSEPEDTEHITWLFLPMVQEEIDRALLRGGITDPADVRLRLENSQLPNEVDVLLDMEYETLSDLNELAEATDGLSKADMEKLGAVVMLAEPKSAAQIKNLAESLELFDFAPGTHTPEDYGKYMIRQSGRFDYDENLDAFYDYEKYGAQRMNEEDGMFTDRGYIAYKGYTSIGATNYSQKTIYISEASATLHEFGHFLDWTLGIPAEHEQLYLAEAQTWTCFEALEKNNWSG